MKKNITPNVVKRILIIYCAILLVFFAALSLGNKSQEQTEPYKNPNLAIDERVKDLLGRMTLEEKTAQMMCVWMQKPNDNSRVPKEQMPFGGKFSPAAAKQLMPDGIGQFARQRELLGPRESAEYANAVQKWLK